MTEKKTSTKKPKIDEKAYLADHQEYCKLKLDYENLRKEAKKKFSKLDRMQELEKALRGYEGKYAATKKEQGIAKISLKGDKFFISQDVPNPKLIVAKFSKEQQAQYFK